MTLKKFTRVEAFATANAFVFDFGGRRGDHRYIYLLRARLRNYLIGLVGFEPTASRRIDRSTVAFRVHPYLGPSCNTARAVLLRNGWRTFRCGAESTAVHVLSPWIHQRCDG